MDENAERISLELIAGDEQAFDTVYKQYYRGLCAFASQYVNSTRIRGDRTRRDDVAVGKPKIPSSGHVPEITPFHDCPQ